MSSILLALAASVSWGISDFMGGFLTRRFALAPVLLISQAAGLAMLLGLAAFTGPPALTTTAIAFAVLASAGGLVGIAALYRAMAVGVVSIVAPISATGAALPVLYGALRGERATLLQALGIVLALIGVVLASRSPEPKGAGRGSARSRGVGLALVAAAGFGVFFVFLHEASTTDVLWVGVVLRLTGVAVVALVALVLRMSVSIGWRRAPAAIVIGVLDTSANALYASASTSGLVSIAAVLASLFPVVTVILARVILHERLSRSQAGGVTCALTGVALIAWP